MAEIEKQVLAQGRYVRLIRCRGWEYAERTNTAGVVVIVALSGEDRIVLVEQHRAPVGKRVIELPAGLVGDHAGEAREGAEEAARRELLEETGYEAGEWTYLTEGPTSAGLTNEMVTFLLAADVQKRQAGGGLASEHEEIQVHEVPLAEAFGWLADRVATGVLIDPKVYAGLYFAGRRRNRPGADRSEISSR